MITIDIEFYDKETEFIVEDIRIDLPEEMVFEAAGSSDISEINSLMYDLSDDMINYVVKYHPETKEKFSMYLHSFIGRHGLGPEYD